MRNVAVTKSCLTVFLSLSLGCAGGKVQPTDAGGGDAGTDGAMPDNNGTVTNNANNPTDLFDVAEPMTVVREGTRGLLLHGLVLTPDEYLEDAQVLVVGSEIVCVADDCTRDPDAGNATWIATKGIISPGLIDAHNHLPYNFLPEWVPPNGVMFENRYQWADNPSYEEHVAPFTTHRSSGSHFCPAARWGELRSLVHATTTMQGQSANQTCIRGGVRNADHEHRLQYDHMRTTVESPRDITDEQAQNYIDSFDQPNEPITRFAVHMAEGYASNNILEEFGSFAGRDTRDNRHQGVSLLHNETSILIHSIALTSAELDEVKATGSKIVWSPSSNLVLYGRTAPIDQILERGIPTAIGPDWTISGEDDMLAELRFARNYAVQRGIPALTPKKLWEMATSEGALVLGIDGLVGKLEVGYRADIAVFMPVEVDPYHSVIESRASDVALVLVDGEAFYGDAHLQDNVSRGDQCDSFSACGSEKFLCVSDFDNEAFEDYTELRQRLVDILEGNGFPPEEQYRRGDELLELVACD